MSLLSSLSRTTVLSGMEKFKGCWLLGHSLTFHVHITLFVLLNSESTFKSQILLILFIPSRKIMPTSPEKAERKVMVNVP